MSCNDTVRDPLANATRYLATLRGTQERKADSILAASAFRDGGLTR